MAMVWVSTSVRPGLAASICISVVADIMLLVAAFSRKRREEGITSSRPQGRGLRVCASRGHLMKASGRGEVNPET